jgi:hypothetical protein
LPALQIDETICSDREKPRFEGAPALIFRQKRLAIGAGRKAVRPEIRGEVFRFSRVGATRAQDTDQLAVITAPQLRGGRRFHGEDTLNKGQVFFMTRRRSFHGHRAEENGVAGLERQPF